GKCTPLNACRLSAAVIQGRARTAISRVLHALLFTRRSMSATDLRRLGLTVLIVAASALAQNRPSHASAPSAAAAQGDAVVDGLKFHRAGGFVQVVDVAKNQSAGTVILPPNQPPVFAAMPGYDGQMRAAYEKYSQGDTGTAVETKESAKAASERSNPTATGFDAANKTVTLSDGSAVTFVDNDNLRVQMP